MLVASSLTDRQLFDLARAADHLDAWSRRFIVGIGALVLQGRRLSASQREALERIAERILTTAGCA